MKKRHKIILLSGLAVVIGATAYWKWMFRMPLKEFTQYALYMAVMDDEICRNELEGNLIGDTMLSFRTYTSPSECIQGFPKRYAY